MNKTIQEIANEIPTQLKNLIHFGVSQPNQFIFAKFFYCLSKCFFAHSYTSFFSLACHHRVSSCHLNTTESNDSVSA